MSIHKDEVPGGQLNSSTNANLKEQLNEGAAANPVPDDSVPPLQENQEQDHTETGNEEKGIANGERHRPSGKGSLGDGSTESANTEGDDKHDDALNPAAEDSGSDWDAFDKDMENNLPSTVALLTTPGGSKVYVVGTVHYSLKSQEDVARLIRAVRPNYVILELCKTRSVMLQWDEETVFQQAQNISFSEAVRKSFQLGFLEGLFFITLFSLSVRMTKALGIAPGGEFRIAFREAQKIPNCVVIFGDLPIALTLKRLFSTLSPWQVIKIVTFFLFKNKTMSQEEVEKYRNMDEVEKMLLQFSKESPEISRVLVNERDAVLTYFMQLAAKRREPNVVVGVVGLGHLMGIKENWGKVLDEQMTEIMRVPPPRKHHRIIKYSIKFTAIGLVLYGVHKIASKSSLYRVVLKRFYLQNWARRYIPAPWKETQKKIERHGNEWRILGGKCWRNNENSGIALQLRRQYLKLMVQSFTKKETSSAKFDDKGIRVNLAKIFVKNEIIEQRIAVKAAGITVQTVIVTVDQIVHKLIDESDLAGPYSALTM